MAGALINVPRSVKRGQVFEVKVLMSHPMETGYRPGTNGSIIPRNIIQTFRVTYGDGEVFRMEMSPAVAANPFVSFFARAGESGPMVFTWSGDNGFSAKESAQIQVE